MAITIEGTCDPRFKKRQRCLRGQLRNAHEVGASVAMYIDGKQVVDLWGGYADKARTRPWTRDTLVNIYSTTKGLAAMCAHRLVDQGKLDLDAPVAKYWPEFAQAGKDKLPVRYLLSHRAGLPAIRKTLPPEALYDWKTMTDAIAAQEPWWVPGTKHGYHAITYGWLVGEVVRRASGKTLGTYFRDEIVSPLGLDAHIGLSASHDARTSNIIPSPPPPPGTPNPLAELLCQSRIDHLQGDHESRRGPRSRCRQQPRVARDGIALGQWACDGALVSPMPMRPSRAVARSTAIGC